MRKNTIFLILYEIAIHLAPLVTAPYIARVLGANGTGIYSYTYSITSYFVLAIQLGVSLYGRREIASKFNKKDLSKCFWEIFASITIMFSIISVCYFIAINLFLDEYKLYMLYQYMLLIAAWLDISWLFFGMEKFKVAVLRNLIVKFLSMILVFMIIRNQDDVSKYIIIMSVSNLLGVVVMWLSLKNNVEIVKVKIKDIKPHFKELFILFIPILAIQLYSITDKVCLGFISTIESVGIYENVYKISKVPLSIITAIGTVMLPRITKIISSGQEEKSLKYLNKSLSINLFIAIGCMCGMIGISKNFVLLYLGTEYSSGISILRVLTIILVFVAWGNVFRMQYILPKKMDNIYIRSVVIGAIINIVLNFILIPKFSGFGAAIASVISEFIICFYQSYKIRKDFNFIKIIKDNAVYLCSGLIMMVILLIIENTSKMSIFLTLMLQMFIGGSTFLLLTLLFEAIVKKNIITNEIQMFIKKLLRIKGAKY